MVLGLPLGRAKSRVRKESSDDDKESAVVSDLALADGFHELGGAIATTIDLTDGIATKLAYKTENVLSSNQLAKVEFLAVLTMLLILVLAAAWSIAQDYCERDNDESCIGMKEYKDSLFLAWMVLAAGGVDETKNMGERVVLSLGLIAGMFVFAILVGFITDGISSTMEELNLGRTAVVEKNHTVILGWNSSTARVVKEFALVRRAWIMQNETWQRRLMPWTRVPPSTSIAKSRIVILANGIEKQEMEDELIKVMENAGISPDRTKVGRDVVVRVGDPRQIHSLLRVGVSKARAVIIMMTENDLEEEEISEGKVYSGATVRTLLAVRNVLSTSAASLSAGLRNRVIVQLAKPSPYVHAAMWRSETGERVVYALNVRANALLFGCAKQPGLASVLLDLMSFEDTAFRVAMASDFVGGALVGATPDDARARMVGGLITGVLRDGNESPVSCFDIEGDVIGPKDKIIYVASNSSPEVSAVPREYKDDDVEKPNSLKRAEPVRHVLVCGWRLLWENTDMLQRRLVDVAYDIPKGSVFHFLNLVPKEIFDADFERSGWTALTEGKAKTVVGWESPDGNLTVLQTNGDAAKKEDLEAILTSDNDFNAMVVLSTQYGEGNLPKSVQDSRVLAVTLQARYILGQKRQLRPVHIVTEIVDDECGTVLLPPKAEVKDARHVVAPDFVNLSALTARILSQVTAFPELEKVWEELLSTSGKEIYLVRAGLLVPTGKPVTYGMLRAIIRKQNHENILLGWRTGNEAVLAPHADTTVELDYDDVLVVVADDSKTLFEPEE